MIQASERTVYINGAFVSETKATISIFDRGFLFADAIYEVVAVVGGRLLDFKAHMERLVRSGDQLKLELPSDMNEILPVMTSLIDLNQLDEGLVYLQISRGVADRDFSYPSPQVNPTVVMFTQVKNIRFNPIAQRGMKVVTVPDLRWMRRDIKTTQLLYSSMAKMEAASRGADDAWLVDGTIVTEGTSNNAWILDNDGVLSTHAVSNSILSGITRYEVLKHIKALGLRVAERAFSIEEAMNAREAFITSATSFLTPVVEINGHPVGDGSVGPVSIKLREIYIRESIKAAMN